MLLKSPFVFFLALFLLCHFTSPAQAIINYYRLLADYDDDIKMYPISQHTQTWQVQNSSAPKATVIVDPSNNFIEVKDKTEGDLFTLQLTLLKKANGETLVAVVKNHMNIFFHGEIHILRFRNGRWNDITESVIPPLTYKDFTKQQVSLAAMAYNPHLDHQLQFGYQLPRKGSTAFAQIQTQVLKEKCAANDASVQEYCAALKDIAYSSIELKWQPYEGKFKIGNKQ